MGSKIKKLLFIGDIVGDNGYWALKYYLPKAIEKYEVDFVIVNGENRRMPYHSGLTSKDAYEMLKLGVDVITLGNHVIAAPCIKEAMSNGAPVIRPINIPKISGYGFIVIVKLGLKFLVLNAIGQKNMAVSYDNVISALEDFFDNIDISQFHCVFLDMHGECSVEKLVIAHYFCNKLTAVVGTHTHVPTNDCRIIGKSTAFQSDAGMTGNYGTLKGRFYDWVIMNKLAYWNGFNSVALNRMPASFNTKTKTMCCTLVCFDSQNRKAISIKPIIYGDTLFGAIK